MIPEGFELMRLGLDPEAKNGSKMPGLHTRQLQAVLNDGCVLVEEKWADIKQMLGATEIRAYTVTDTHGNFEVYTVWIRDQPNRKTIALVSSLIFGVGFTECYVVTTVHDLLAGCVVRSEYKVDA